MVLNGKQFICLIGIFLVALSSSLAQTGYKDELGREISREYFEKQILEQAYFGIPDGEEGKMLVYRMPVGLLDDPEIFFEKTGNKGAFKKARCLWSFIIRERMNAILLVWVITEGFFVKSMKHF